MKSIAVVFAIVLMRCMSWAAITVPSSSSSGDISSTGSVSFSANESMGGFGILSLLAPVSSTDAANKNYVDTSTSNSGYIKKDGSITFTGNASMGGLKLLSLATPTSNTDAATKSYIDNKLLIAVIEEQQSAGTNAGTASTGSYIDRVLNTVVFDDIGVSLASNTVTIPAGTYQFEWDCPFAGTVNECRTRLYNNTSSAAIAYSVNSSLMAAGVYYIVHGRTGKVVFGSSTDVKIQYQVGTSVATSGLGHESSAKWGGSEVETYCSLKIMKY